MKRNCNRVLCTLGSGNKRLTDIITEDLVTNASTLCPELM